MSPALVAAAGLGIAALILSRTSSAAKPLGTPLSKSPAQRMAEVIATGDPALIQAEALRLASEGHAAEAGELSRVAGEIAAAKAKGVTPTVVQKPPAAPATKPPSSASSAPATVPSQTSIAVVQQRLVQLGWRIAVDGKNGPETIAAVKQFQTVNGVKPVDGIVGPLTVTALYSPSAKGPAAVAGAPAVAAPAPAPKPTTPPPPAAPKPSVAPAAAAPAPVVGKAPTITKNLSSLPAILKNGAPSYPAPASSGQAVKDWQKVLMDLGFLAPGTPDGKFGPGTEVATRQFQTAANTAAAKSGKSPLTVDGKVGPATVARAAEARIMPSGPATFTGDEAFGDDAFTPPPRPIADSPLPGYMPEMRPVEPDPRRALAARLYNMLELAPRGGEDRTLVQRYQQQEGLKATGLYTPGTALSLAQKYGIVPPKPLYWTESRTRQSKAHYRDMMRMLGERDPQRVEEWNRAGAV